MQEQPPFFFFFGGSSQVEWWDRVQVDSIVRNGCLPKAA